MIIKCILLAALIRLLIAKEKPFLCSTLYVIPPFVFGLAWGEKISELLISTGIGFALASVYFWLLNWLESGSVIWWLVAISGLAIGFV